MAQSRIVKAVLIPGTLAALVGVALLVHWLAGPNGPGRDSADTGGTSAGRSSGDSTSTGSGGAEINPDKDKELAHAREDIQRKLEAILAKFQTSNEPEDLISGFADLEHFLSSTNADALVPVLMEEATRTTNPSAYRLSVMFLLGRIHSYKAYAALVKAFPDGEGEDMISGLIMSFSLTELPKDSELESRQDFWRALYLASDFRFVLPDYAKDFLKQHTSSSETELGVSNPDRAVLPTAILYKNLTRITYPPAKRMFIAKLLELPELAQIKILERIDHKDPRLLEQAIKLAEGTTTTEQVQYRVMELLADNGTKKGAMALVKLAADILTDPTASDLSRTQALTQLSGIEEPSLAAQALERLYYETQYQDVSGQVLRRLASRPATESLSAVSRVLQGDLSDGKTMQIVTGLTYRQGGTNGSAAIVQRDKILISLLQHPSPAIRKQVVESVWISIPSRRVELLEHVADNDPNADVRKEARNLLDR